jgi:hypothetical protein
MGLRTTIGAQGVVTDKTTSTTDQLVLNAPVKNKVTVFGAGVSATVSDPFSLFNPAAAGVTGSLPAISSADVGNTFTFLKNAGTNPLLVSASNAITDGGAWTVVAATAGQTYKVMAVSGVNGFYWHVV